MRRKRRIPYFWLAALCLLIPVTVWAQSWFTANQVTLAWDPVAKIAPTDTIKYQVYARTDTTSAGQPVGAEVTATQAVITFAAEGRYYLGVRTIRYPQGETIGIPSDGIAWSNDAAACGPAGAFGVIYYMAPAKAKGLKLG